MGCLVFGLVSSATVQDEAAKANTLYTNGKKIEALRLYEDLTRAQPKEFLYFQRLADCLAAESTQVNEGAEAVAIRTKMRDAAKHAVELGASAEFLRVMANIDPSKPLGGAPNTSPGAALLKEAEKAYGAGDFATAMAKYTAAAEADPQLYEAALFAGDTAFTQKDLPTAAKWFNRAITIDPNRETAYRYWGDAIFRYGSDPSAAKDKFIDAIVAEPYNKMAWQGLQQWAQTEKAVIAAPNISIPGKVTVDPHDRKKIRITVDPEGSDEKKHPGASAWLMYSLVVASYQGDQFKKEFPDEKEYRDSLKEKDAALSGVVEVLKEKKTRKEDLDESLGSLLELSDAGMIDCFILISGADDGMAWELRGHVTKDLPAALARLC